MTDERDERPSPVQVTEGPPPERPGEFLPRKGRTFVTVLAAIVTLVTGGLTLAKLDVLLVVVGATVSAAAFELYWVYVLRNEVAQLRETARSLASQLEDHRDDEEGLTITRRLANSILTYIDYTDPEYGHDWCFVRERVEEFDVSGTDGTMRISLRGYNQSGESVEHYYTAITAESSLHGFEERFSATQDGQDLHAEVVDADRNSRVVRIHFRRPIAPGEEFEFEFLTRFRDEFEEPESYVFFPVNRYEGGIDSLVGRLVLDESPYSFRLSHITGVRNDSEISINQRSRIVEEVETGDRVRLEFEERDPTGVYVLEFTRSDL